MLLGLAVEGSQYQEMYNRRIKNQISIFLISVENSLKEKEREAERSPSKENKYTKAGPFCEE